MTKRRNSAKFCAVVLFFLLYQLFLCLHNSPVWGAGNPDCDINSGPCFKKTGASEVIFEINPKPVKAMQELTFIIKIKGGTAADNLIVSLGMPGMYMGENKVIATKSAAGAYSGKGVIPGCFSGKNLWQATVETPKGEKADFLFNVIY